jgi:hypothetical protein
MLRPFVLAIALILLAACGGNDDTSTDTPIGCLAHGETRQAFALEGFYGRDLASDGRTLYVAGGYLQSSQLDVWSVALDGSSAPKRVEGAKDALRRMAVGPQGSLVFLTEERTPTSNGEAVRLNGVLLQEPNGRVVPLANETEKNASVLDHLVADDGGVSWASGGRDSFTLWRWNAATGEKRAVGETSCCFSIVADASEIFYARFASDATTIFAAPLAGGAPRVVTTFPGLSQMTLVALDADSLYYVPSSNDVLVAIPRAGGPPSRAYPGLTQPVRRWTFDGTHLYWVETGTEGVARALVRMHLATGRKETVVLSSSLTSALAADACNVYYADGTTVFARGK